MFEVKIYYIFIVWKDCANGGVGANVLVSDHMVVEFTTTYAIGAYHH